MKKAFYWVLFSLSALLPFGLGWLINWLDALRAQTFEVSLFFWLLFAVAAGGAVIGSFWCFTVQSENGSRRFFSAWSTLPILFWLRLCISRFRRTCTLSPLRRWEPGCFLSKCCTAR